MHVSFPRLENLEFDEPDEVAAWLTGTESLSGGHPNQTL